MSSTSFNVATSAASRSPPTNDLAQMAVQRLNDSPIAQILPYLTTSLSIIGSIFTFTTTTLLRPLLILSPLPVLLYVFAPLTVFVDVLTTLVVRVPYWTASYLLDALFPLYVLCGVACITGGILGFGGRALAQVLVGLLAEEGKPVEPPVVVKVEVDEKRGEYGRGNSKARKERVKFER